MPLRYNTSEAIGLHLKYLEVDDGLPQAVGNNVHTCNKKRKMININGLVLQFHWNKSKEPSLRWLEKPLFWTNAFQQRNEQPVNRKRESRKPNVQHENALASAAFHVFIWTMLTRLWVWMGTRENQSRNQIKNFHSTINLHASQCHRQFHKARLELSLGTSWYHISSTRDGSEWMNG